MSTNAARSLVDQALENLVNQFARPMDCLRELVQNSLDAGTPRIEVAIDYAPESEDHGVLKIHVDDFGEGMNEDIIDNQLTRMFSSTKEGDLTRIGKFGIGFTSVFAMRPEAVLLHTGRYGEYWELLFHADRSYDKVRVETPVTGTRITIFRRARADEVDDTVREARSVLRYWCEHAQIPIDFQDRTGAPEPTAQADPDDPFAAFAAPPAPRAERISRALDLPGCRLVEEERDEGIEILVGVGETPMYGYYNGGLTLARSGHRDLLGPYAARLGHLCFKVRADALDHTLTRDSVLHNDDWHRVMGRVIAVAERLSPRIVQAAEAACARDDDLSPWHAALAGEARACPGRSSPVQRAIRRRPIFRGHDGPISIDELERPSWGGAGLLLHPGDGALARAIHAEGWGMIRADAHTLALVQALDAPLVQAFLGATHLTVVRAEDRFVLPTVVPHSDYTEAERALMERVTALLTDATQGRATVILGTFSSRGNPSEFFVEAPGTSEVFERSGGGLWTRIRRAFGYRTILLHRDHVHLRSAAMATWAAPERAALGLAAAILFAEQPGEKRDRSRLLSVDPRLR